MACPVAAPPAPPAHQGEVEPACEEQELAVVMFRLQIHAEKLWHAGQAANWPLADFYLHELEEGLEELEASCDVEGGQAVGPLGKTMTHGPQEALEAVVDAGNAAAFASAYDDMLAACNGCHTATAHGFVRIQVPTGHSLTNQDFRP